MALGFLGHNSRLSTMENDHLILRLSLFLLVCMCCAHMCEGVHGHQKKELDHLELELQARVV